MKNLFLILIFISCNQSDGSSAAPSSHFCQPKTIEVEKEVEKIIEVEKIVEIVIEKCSPPTQICQSLNSIWHGAYFGGDSHEINFSKLQIGIINYNIPIYVNGYICVFDVDLQNEYINFYFDESSFYNINLAIYQKNVCNQIESYNYEIELSCNQLKITNTNTTSVNILIP